MLDILNILKWATWSDDASEEYKTIFHQIMPYWDKIGEALSTEFVEELNAMESRLSSLECSEHFERGLWLGLRLGQFAEQGPRGGIGDP